MKRILNVLEKNGIQFKRSHDLRYLLDLLDEAIPIDAELYERIIKLNAFSIEIRYPDLKIDISQDDRNQAISIAKEFREFVKLNLGFDLEKIRVADKEQ